MFLLLSLNWSFSVPVWGKETSSEELTVFVQFYCDVVDTEHSTGVRSTAAGLDSRTSGEDGSKFSERPSPRVGMALRK